MACALNDSLYGVHRIRLHIGVESIYGLIVACLARAPVESVCRQEFAWICAEWTGISTD